MSSLPQAALAELPADIVRTAPEDLAPHLTDWRGQKTGRADALLLPRSTADVVRIVRWAGRHGVGLVPQGGNTGLVGGGVPEPQPVGPVVVLSMRRMAAIESIDPAGLSMVAEAGAILANVHLAAEEAGCRFPLSLGAKGSATVGGRYLAVTSAEYVHWYKGDWGVAAFVDAGNANDERQLFKMNLGYGVGPRWKSPAGPIAVDLAYGQRDHRLRLQFAVAIAF